MYFPITPYQQGPFGVNFGSPFRSMGLPGLTNGQPLSPESFSPQGAPFNPMAQGNNTQMMSLGLMMGMMMGMMGGGMMGGMGGMGGGMFGGMGGMGFGMAPMMMMMQQMEMMLMMQTAGQQGLSGMQMPGMQMPGMQMPGQMPGGWPQQQPSYNSNGGNTGGNYNQVPYSPYTNSPYAPAFPGMGGSRATAAVGVAESQLGVVGGNPQVRQYSQGRSEAWCADFVSWTYENTPGGSPFGHRPGVSSIRSWGEQQNLYHPRGTYQPRPGDILIFGHNQHTGIVEGVDPDGTVHTIEGNSPGYGVQSGESANQGAVARHTLAANSSWITGYVDMQNYQ